jgi:hypothetical protein
MVISEKPDIHAVSLLVGDVTKPCLQANITTPPDYPIKVEDERLREMYNSAYPIARLSNIEALIECVYNEINETYMENHSFGLELLNALVFILNKKYTFVKKVRFNDRSYIPCNRSLNDTVDLMSYSIALYGKTWYERKINAYIENKTIYNDYKNQVSYFTSREFKNIITYESITTKIVEDGTMFAKEELHKNYNKWYTYFMTSPTLPVFFKHVLSDINKNDKCVFCNNWLSLFVGSYVTLHREWIFDIPVNYIRTSASKSRRRKNRL